MFNGLFQPTHLLLILVVVLIVFGPGKLPEVGKALGKTVRDMRNAFAGSEEDEKKENIPAPAAGAKNAAAVTTVTGTAKEQA